MTKAALSAGISGQDEPVLAEFLLENDHVDHSNKRSTSSFNTPTRTPYLPRPEIDSANSKLHHGELSITSNITCGDKVAFLTENQSI